MLLLWFVLIIYLHHSSGGKILFHPTDEMNKDIPKADNLSNLQRFQLVWRILRNECKSIPYKKALKCVHKRVGVDLSSNWKKQDSSRDYFQQFAGPLSKLSLQFIFYIVNVFNIFLI
jgi:hypothetical protein